MGSETPQHQRLKELICAKLKEWFGVTITEFPSSGHELDVFSISPKGLELMVEIIWTPSTSNFYRDLTILYQSDAHIKILIVNEEILSKNELVREFEKARVSETKKGCIVPEMINGSRILSNVNYNLMSGEVAKRGQYAELKLTDNRPPFDEWWKNSLDIISNWDDVTKHRSK